MTGWMKTGRVAVLVGVVLVVSGVAFHAARRRAPALDARAPAAAPGGAQRTASAVGWQVERRIPLDLQADPTALAVDARDRFVVAGDGAVQVIDQDGRRKRRLPLASPVLCLTTRGDEILAGCADAIRVWSTTNAAPAVWPLPAEGSVLTCLAASPHGVFAADYAHRCVWRIGPHGRVGGVVRAPEPKGFHVPSPYFDVVWQGAMLWVVDTGRHRVRAFSPEGQEQRAWGASGMEPGHFAGCCNPSHLAMLPDGSFVTSEKGLPRISTYGGDGDFKGLISAPNAEGVGPEPMDLAVLSDGRVAALDSRRRRVIIFRQEPAP